MCGRYALEPSEGELASWLSRVLGRPSPPRATGESGATASWTPSWNIGPTMSAPVLTRPPGTTGGHLDTMRWGVSAAGGGGRPLINARLETVDRKVSFRDAIRRNRVVVPISAFYEWRIWDGRRHPYAIRPAETPLLLLAGLWTTEAASAGFCILTEPATPPIASIHDRMPVMLDSVAATAWLSEEADGDGWNGVLERRPRVAVECHPVSSRVNSIAQDGRDLLDPVAAPEVASPGLFDAVAADSGDDPKSPDESP